MKISTVILAGLMTMTSVAAFAEGGSERSKEFYKNFTFVQEQTHGADKQTALADGKSVKPAAAEQTTEMQQPNS